MIVPIIFVNGWVEDGCLTDFALVRNFQTCTVRNVLIGKSIFSMSLDETLKTKSVVQYYNTYRNVIQSYFLRFDSATLWNFIYWLAHLL